MPKQKQLRDITEADITAAFKRATVDAALQAHAAGLSVTGLDVNNNLVEVHPDWTVTPHPRA